MKTLIPEKSSAKHLLKRKTIVALLTSRWPLKLFALGLAVAGVLLDHKYEVNGKDSTFFERLTIAIMFVIIVFLVEAILGLYEQAENITIGVLENLSDSTDRISKDVSQAKAHGQIEIELLSATIDENFKEIKAKIQTQITSFEIANAIIDYPPPHAKILKKVEEERSSMLELEPKGWSVRHHPYVMATYEKVWQLLADCNREWAKTHNGVGLKIKAVHSLHVGLLKESTMRVVRQKEIQIINDKGNISRILAAPNETPSAEHKKAAERMNRANVQVTYYDMGRGFPGPTYSWDFLIIEELNLYVVWEAIDSQQQVGRMLVTSDPNYKGMIDLRDAWARLSEHSISFEKFNPAEYAENWEDS